MKRYCLKPEAKSQIIKSLAVVTVTVFILLIAIGFVWFLFWVVLNIPPLNITTIDYVLVTIGWFVWAFLLYYTGAAVYYWLKYNIVECEDTK